MNWRKSSHSMNDGQCVEAASGEGAILVRDSKNPDGPALAFTPDQWQRFLAGLR